MKPLLRVGILITSFAFTLVLFVAALEVFLAHRHARWAAAEKPHYKWSLVTADGTRLGTQSGPLQLLLRPFIVYGNRPNQTDPRFSVDARGFRRTTEPSGANAATIVVVGGSTAFGTGLASDGETFSSQLAQILGTRVVNAAVVGHQSGQELAGLATGLVDLRPSLVIALDGWNDYGFRTHERFLGVASFEQIELEMKKLANLMYPPSMWQRLARIPVVVFPRASQSLMTRTDMLMSRLGIGYRFFPSRERRAEISEAAEVYAENVRKMNVISGAFGARFLCVVQPQNRVPRYAKSNPKYDQFVSIAAARLAADGVPFLDMNDPDHRPMFPGERFLDLVHLDATGNRTLAQVVADEIQRRGWLKPVASRFGSDENLGTGTRR